MARLFFALLALALLPACATITTSPSQDFTVVTEPPGADCEIQRGTRPVGRVNPTPGTLRVGKSASDMNVVCTREGHLPATATLKAEFQPMFLGNILVGGIVGIIVDASTGASSRYPDSVQIAMQPDPAARPPVPPAPMTMDPIPDPEPIRPRRAGRGRAGA